MGKDMTIEQLAAEVERTRAATSKITALLADTTLWESLQIAAFHLADATDDLNDEVRRVEGMLRNRHIRPGWVPIDDGDALTWTGEELGFDDGTQARPLLRVSRLQRLQAVSVLPALISELARPRS